METPNHFINREDAIELEVIQESAIALVREFLNRKGCKKSLAALDEEIPRNSSSLCNRAELAQAIHVAQLIRKNKTLPTPFRTIIEMIVWDLTKKYKMSSEKQIIQRPATATAESVADASQIECKDVDNIVEPTRSKPLKKQRPLSSRGLRAHNPTINPMIVPGLLVTKQAHQNKNRKASSVAEMLSASPEKVISSQDLNSAMKQQNIDAEKNKLKECSELKNSKTSKLQEAVLQDLDDSDNVMEEKCIKWLSGSDKLNFKYNMNTSPSIVHDLKKQKSDRKVAFNLSQSAAPLNFETAQKLRKLVFGTTNSHIFSEAWVDQPFTFRECDDGVTPRLRFGIIQKKGGPCGLLAAVQTHVLKHLLFREIRNNGDEGHCSEPSWLNVSNDLRTTCLAEAIIEILWRAGGKQRAVVTLPSRKCSFIAPAGYKEDGVTEYLTYTNCQSLESLHNIIYNNIGQFENGRCASILLLYSAILSRGIDEVTGDMDDPGNFLMGAHSYCTQEIVNLLTIGVAASNTFNDTVTLHKDILLRGTTSRSDIGLLSLFEHYGSCSVGSYLKTPRYPIWIVCSESHFSVLFSLNRNIVDEQSVKGAFDLYYYDGLANQDEEIKLTIDTSQKSLLCGANDLIPPLDLCIQTKWPNCYVDWNGTEPLL